MSRPQHEFWREAGRLLNSGQSRCLILSGSIHDLFYLPNGAPSERRDPAADEYVPLIDFLTATWDLPDKIRLVYELNGPLRFVRSSDAAKLRDAWFQWRTGQDADEWAVQRMLAATKKQAAGLVGARDAFDAAMHDAIGRPTVALELLRQLCLCSRSTVNGKPLLKEDLIVLIEGADLLIPVGEIGSLSEADRHRVSICRDWFCDPGFMNGGDAVILVAESRSLINERVARLPQILSVEVPAPDHAERLRLIEWFAARQRRPDANDRPLKMWCEPDELAQFTAGLSTHALLQLLRGARYAGRSLTLNDVIDKVEQYIQSQLGEDIVEFKKPAHTLEDVVGFRRLKTFLADELIPRFQTRGLDALPGAAVAGPIGGGKTFIFEAVAAELDMVVLVLKNIRSQWFGQTDVVFERLRRVLDALDKVVIFVDEADTQFGGVEAGAHATERRLTGKIQAMMSDPKLRGRVFWLLMTARIHQLSPDIRRPGRVGDLIIPVLDPEGKDDCLEFLRWAVQPVLHDPDPDPNASDGDAALNRLTDAIEGYSAANYAALRSELKAKAVRNGGHLDMDQILAVVHDHLPPAIGATRRYQTLQALINCTRRSLLPDPDVDASVRENWAVEIRALEAKGIR